MINLPAVVNNEKEHGLTIKAKHPLVSVIIRTYNRLPFLLEAIESVRVQTFPEWELIIVDDGSTDGTADIVRQIKDPRISVVEIDHSGHINYVMNEGVKRCKGEWLAFLDSDDLWLPHKLELQLKKLKESGKKWSYTAFEFVDESNHTIYYSSEKFSALEGNILKEVIEAKTGITICSVMVQRSFFDEVGGFTINPLLREDYEFFLRIASRAEVAFVPEVVTKIRDHSKRIYKSRKFPNERTVLAYKAFIAQKPEKKYRKLARRQIAFLLSEASVHRFANGQPGMALRQLWQSLIMRDKPRHWLSTFKKGIHAASKKYIRATAKAGKKKDVAAYSS